EHGQIEPARADPHGNFVAEAVTPECVDQKMSCMGDWILDAPPVPETQVPRRDHASETQPHLVPFGARALIGDDVCRLGELAGADARLDVEVAGAVEDHL